MGDKLDRDVEKVYSTSEFAAKLRRLADLKQFKKVGYEISLGEICRRVKTEGPALS